MVINFLLPMIGDSGGMRVIYKYSELLTLKGHDVVIYRSIKASNMHRYKLPFVNTIHRIYCSIKALLKIDYKESKYDKIVRSFTNSKIRNADVSVATSWPTAYALDRLNSNKGKKFYFVQDYEIWDNQKYVNNSYKLNLNKIVISTWINQQLKNNLGIGPFPIIYNGIDLTNFYSGEKKYAKKGEMIKCLMLNHHLKRKGVQEGIAAFELAKKVYNQLELTMFGLDSGESLPNYIHYMENPSPIELKRLYIQADIFIFPSLSEGWGLTPIEAMAYKCAVVGSKTGFVLDIGEHRENMMIAEPGDFMGIAQYIVELCNDFELRMKISEAGNLTVKKLDWEKSVNKLCEEFGQGYGEHYEI